jgi:hypothetical protein
VEVEGAFADSATTRKRHDSLLTADQQGPKNAEAGAHFIGKLGGNLDSAVVNQF